MKEKKIKISAMNCNHCVATINRELTEIIGIEDIDANLESRMVTIKWSSPASWEQISKTLTEIGYPPSE
ncbi:MAG: heavy-metal-associated domain-containing protein [Deltaproteobacteria bacterium]|jgi:copper chaperone CopZ|nr:heavy-metal-associated domain-containing protein [Deltaproteobacteria bacterium]